MPRPLCNSFRDGFTEPTGSTYDSTRRSAAPSALARDGATADRAATTVTARLPTRRNPDLSTVKPRTQVVPDDGVLLLLRPETPAGWRCLHARYFRSIRPGPRRWVMNRDAHRYLFGIFYCNRDDPRLTVRKRYGWGWTLNYGRPMAWLWTFGAPAAMGLIVYLSKR
ncbi:DUF5808 domain-containing protein [Streptomyces mirabilis]|uniref:DUF5808 domain-containing protein n=1 Tax=Streptomyces mirabilis TaxID=68239 RepID=UPI0036456B30